MSSDDAFHIAIFCKPPAPGAVKTRLIPAFGAAGAASIYAQLARRTLDTVRTTCEHHNATASLWVGADTDRDARHESIQRWSHDFNLRVHRQIGGNLGERMQHCLQTMCNEHQRTLLIGTDCPVFSTQHLVEAASSLTASCAWVFTPAEDGGYVLVGSNQPCAAPFSNISWSTAAVMQQTRSALAAAQLSWRETAALWDVDDPADVARAVRNQQLSPPPT